VKLLHDIKILDLTRVYTGPFCTQILADLGADVLKIEDLGSGTNDRAWPPFARDSFESCYFLSMNRGKKSIEINLKSQSGKGVFYELLADADVVIENYRPGIVKKLGVDYESCKKIQPNIIYCSISAFGQYGPLSSLPGYDILAQAMGGLLAITGTPELPMKVGSSIADVLAGMYACNAILASIINQKDNREGQYIDIALVDSVFACLESAATNYLLTGKEPKRIGSQHQNGGPYGLYTAKDGYVALVASNERMWPRFCKATGIEGLENNPMYYNNQVRLDNQQALLELVNKWMKNYTVDEAIALLKDNGLPAAPVMKISDICTSEYMKARNMVVTYDHPVVGRISVPGTPIKFDHGEEALATLAPPYKGQHTKEVLSDLGYSEKDISALVENGAIGKGYLVGRTLGFDER